MLFIAPAAVGPLFADRLHLYYKSPEGKKLFTGCTKSPEKIGASDTQKENRHEIFPENEIVPPLFRKISVLGAILHTMAPRA
ncbi:hypothetical protein [Oscillibacter valericigenes]|uniref:hypothetical protein n=1 Tax=Oscillibacter valericigenes TaxID=351091 RepID=UPI001F193662|nr:hypothetical protein [Oscillibacter valericigenes]